MMKKISKLALLAAATAFLLAAFPACSDDDSNKTELDGSENTGGDSTGGESTGGDSTGGGSSGGAVSGGDGTGQGSGDEDDDDKDKEEQKVLAVTYDLTKTLPTGIPVSGSDLGNDGKDLEKIVDVSWAAPTATPATNDVTWAWVATKNRKVKSNKGLQVSIGKNGAYDTKSEEIIKLTADEPIVVTVTFDFTGKKYADDNPDGTEEAKLSYRGITVGDGSVVMSADLGVTKDDNIRTCKNSTAAKEVSIKANGIRITKIETAPAQ